MCKLRHSYTLCAHLILRPHPDVPCTCDLIIHPSRARGRCKSCLLTHEVSLTSHSSRLQKYLRGDPLTRADLDQVINARARVNSDVTTPLTKHQRKRYRDRILEIAEGYLLPYKSSRMAQDAFDEEEWRLREEEGRCVREMTGFYDDVKAMRDGRKVDCYGY